MEGLIFGGAYLRRENLHFQIVWASLIVGSKLCFLLCFTLHLKAIFQVQAPGSLYLEGRFNGEFFFCVIYMYMYLEKLIHGGAYFWNFTVPYLYEC